MVLELEDFEIDPNNLDVTLKQLMKHIRPQWEPNEVKNKVVTGGITNQLLLCYMDGNDDKILVRLYGKGTDKIIDRQMELKNTVKLYEAGLSAPVYCQFANGLAYGYIFGVTTDENMVRDPKIYKLVSSHMAKFHSVSIEAGATSILFPKLRIMVDNVPESFSDPQKDKKFKEHFPSMEKLHTEMNEMEQIIDNLESKIVFSHNDCLLGNIIYNKSKDDVNFIDFEYSGPNYQPYDIANHFCEFAGIEDYKPELYPDETLQRCWIHNYLEEWHKIQKLGEVKDEDVEKMFHLVDDMSMVPNFMWSIWAIVQAVHSTIDFDYLGYAIDRMDDYFRRKKKLMERKRS